MLNALLFALQLATVSAIAAAMVRPGWRRRTAAAVAGLGLLALASALAGGSALRTLEIFHSFAAFDGPEIRLMPFAVDLAEAPAYQWGVVVAAFCFGWAGWLRYAAPIDGDPTTARPGARVHAFWGPMALCWTSIALLLALQKSAAPEGLVTPLGFDRAILPPAIGACILLAWAHRRVLLVLSWLALFVTFARVPLVIFGTFATHNGWGTSLDVHTITEFANPIAQSPLRVAAYSAEQLGWLLWSPNLLVMPGIYMLSLGGIGFAATMFVTHPKTGEQQAAQSPG